MRFTLFTAAAFAATAIAAPLEKREPQTVTDVAVVYATEVVTVSATSTQTQAAISARATTTSAAGPAGTTYKDKALYHHNIHRANHSAPALTWSYKQAQIAQSIAETCVYAHNVTAGGGGYGQNIAAGVKPANISAIVTDLFYNGEVEWYANLYGQAQPSMTNFEHWGHFSQVVWKGTTQVGCATVDCTGGLKGVSSDVAPYFTVCNYVNPGNYANEYGSNIGSPLGRATASWSTGLYA